MQEGPNSIITYYCSGCIYLEKKNWVFYGENDEIDSGIDATCLKKNKVIASYWNPQYHAPTWCSYLNGVTNEIS